MGRAPCTMTSTIQIAALNSCSSYGCCTACSCGSRRPGLFLAAPRRKGKKMDVTKSLVRDPNDVPAAKSPELETVVTSWRPDKLKDMTYTQFWQLISERQIERVRCFSADCEPARLYCSVVGSLLASNAAHAHRCLPAKCCVSGSSDVGATMGPLTVVAADCRLSSPMTSGQ